MKYFLCVIVSINFSLFVNAATITHWGEKVAVGNGYARTYVQLNNKIPQSMGIALSDRATTGLDHEMKEYILPLPERVKVHPFKHITLDWNPHGHEPGGVYDRPHFDFHFYFISNQLRQSITCMDDDAPLCLEAPDEDYLVSDYAPTPEGVPKMGWHWVDLLSPEFNGGIFTRTFIYGYYAGNLIFIEPMVTTEYLLSKKTSHNTIRLPKQFPYQQGRYPTNYKIYYDEINDLHKIELRAFREQDFGAIK